MTTRDYRRLALAAAAALFLQGSGAFWPVPGYFTGVLAGLAVALVAWRYGAVGLRTWFAACLLLAVLLPGQALIFGLTTGPVGLLIGWGERWRWHPLLTLGLSGAALTLGTFVLTHAAASGALPVDLHSAGLSAYLLLLLAWGSLWLRLLSHLDPGSLLLLARSGYPIGERGH